MTLTVLGASGALGREVVAQALARGIAVVAVSRHPERLTGHDPRLTRLAADVSDPTAAATALSGADTVIGVLGRTKGDAPGVLTAAAEAIAAGRPRRVVTVGGLGTARSAAQGGWLARTALRVAMGKELPDRNGADDVVLAAGGTVLHCGPFTDHPLSDSRRVVGLADVPRRPFPKGVSRATVAASLLDLAATDDHRGEVVVALD